MPFVGMSYPQICDFVEQDIKALLEEEGFDAVAKIDEVRDGEEYAVAFAFSSGADEVIMPVSPYVGNDFKLEPYTPSFSLWQREELR